MVDRSVEAVPSRPGSKLQRLLQIPLVKRMVRYCGASAVSTTIGLVVLATFVATGALTAGWANVVATAAGTGPSFELNRRWVWGRTSRRSLRAEMLPFAALSFASLAGSTLAVSVATGWAERSGFSDPVRVAVALGANLASYGVMWVVQYLFLDRLLFRSGPHGQPAMAQPAAGEFCANPQVAVGSVPASWPTMSSHSNHSTGGRMHGREMPRRDGRRITLKWSRTITAAPAGGSMLGLVAVRGVGYTLRMPRS